MTPVAWSLLMAPWVSYRAGTTAGGRPACIQIALPDGASYREAGSWLDLTAWRMRAVHHRRYGYSNFHGVLFVRRDDARFDRFNWSYRAMAFQPIVGQGHVLLDERPACIPN